MELLNLHSSYNYILDDTFKKDVNNILLVIASRKVNTYETYA